MPFGVSHKNGFLGSICFWSNEERSTQRERQRDKKRKMMKDKTKIGVHENVVFFSG